MVGRVALVARQRMRVGTPTRSTWRPRVRRRRTLAHIAAAHSPCKQKRLERLNKSRIGVLEDARRAGTGVAKSRRHGIPVACLRLMAGLRRAFERMQVDPHAVDLRYAHTPMALLRVELLQLLNIAL